MRAVVGEMLLVLILATLTVSQGNPDAKRLYDDLLSNYNKLVRPVVNVSDALAVQIKLKLSQLIDVNLKNQIMTTNLWVEQTWYDYKLKWEPKDYGGVEMLHVPSDHIWRPDIVLYNNADGNFEVTLATKTTLDYTGRVEWRPPAIYKSSCEIDVEYFPFDEQTCVMKFGSWTYDGFQVDLRHIDESNGTNVVDIGIDLTEFYASVEWDILEVPAIRNEKFYTCCDEPYLDITFNITMRRKTLFYTVNLIIPCMGISFLTILVFYLPSDSGEKVSLSISILLSLTVFFLLLAEIIPPTSLVVPLLGKFVLFTMILDTFSICVTVIVLNVHFRSPQTHTMAPWVRTVFIHHLPKLLFMRRPIYPYDRLRGPGAHRFIVRTCNGLELHAGTCDTIERGRSSCCDHIDTSIPPLPPSVVMQSGLLDHHHHHHLNLMDMDATDSMCLNQCRMHGGNCPSSSDDVVNPHPACVNVNHHHLHHHYQHTNNNTRNSAALPGSHQHHHHHHGQGVFSPTSSTSSSPLAPPRRLGAKSRQLHNQLKTCCLSPGSSDNLSCGGGGGGHLHEADLGDDHHLHHHHHSDYANHELIPVFQSTADLTLPVQPPPLIVDPIITSIAAVAAAAATAALTSLKSEESESGLTNRTLTTTTTITTPKRLAGATGNNKTKNVIKNLAYGGGAKGNINSVSISDNSISISQSLDDDNQDGEATQTTPGSVKKATKASQTPKSTKKKTATATATITKQIPSRCSGGESGGLITTSATITGEADCSLASSDVDGDGGTVSSFGSTLYASKVANGPQNHRRSNGDLKENGVDREGVEDDDDEDEDEDDEEEEDMDEVVNGSGENLVETAISPPSRNRKGNKDKPKKLKPASKTKNPRSNYNSKITNNNNSNCTNKKNQSGNGKQLKTNFDDIAAAAAPEPSGSGTSAGPKSNGLRNRWHGCPELHKAMAGVTYIADHTRKEEESTRVKEDWKFVAMVLDRLFLWIFTIAVVVGTAGIILHAPTLYDTRVPIDIKMSEIATTTAKPHIARPIL